MKSLCFRRSVHTLQPYKFTPQIKLFQIMKSNYLQQALKMAIISFHVQWFDSNSIIILETHLGVKDIIFSDP